LIASTGARIGVGRAGPRPLTRSLLLFQADHAVTQDAIFGDVPQALLERFGMFAVQTQVTTHDEFLLRPDLGRRLTDEAKATIGSRCTKNPNVQIVVGDGLSAAAVTNNLDKIYPVLVDGFRSAGLSLGDPFFIRYCRVGVINDLNTVIGADVVLSTARLISVTACSLIASNTKPRSIVAGSGRASIALTTRPIVVFPNLVRTPSGVVAPCTPARLAAIAMSSPAEKSSLRCIRLTSDCTHRFFVK
jgi:hypothetical protein